MGCQNSLASARTKEQPNGVVSRKDRKPKIVMAQTVNKKQIYQNVKRVEESLSSKSLSKICKIIADHYFFSNFSDDERQELVKQMEIFTCPKDQYIFKQHDPGTLFFILKKGKVRVEVHGEKIKNLGKGDGFGELSLLYTAPRSASIYTETDCILWGLHQNVFKIFNEELILKNYKIAKPLLKKAPIFQFLCNHQLNSIAYNMNSLKFNPGEEIFKEGDDANSFFIIVNGDVYIHLSKKKPICLSKGESFGENVFHKDQVRRGSAYAGESGAHLISIGREGIKKALGDQINEIIQYNILKWALKRSKIFKKIPDIVVRDFIKASFIKQYEHNQIIFKKGDVFNSFVVSLDAKIENADMGVIANQPFFYEEAKYGYETTIKYKTNMKKNGKGSAIFIPLSNIEQLINMKLVQGLRNQQQIFTKILQKKGNQVESENNGKKEKIKKELQIKLQDLQYLKKLGEGQFGQVYLVKEKATNQMYALKCIKKKQIIDLGMVNFVIREKQILTNLYHPFIVKLEKSLKDKAFIYFLLEYIDGVDFFDMLRQIGLCSVSVSRFYLASLILAIEQLHRKNIIYRDLKPENAVLDSKGNLYLTDMGAAKYLEEEKGNRTFTMIGTPNYMAPQIMQGKGYGLEADIWSLGIILYEMVCGRLPYGENIEDPYEIYKQILNSQLKYPKFFTNQQTKDQIQRLLRINVSKRRVQNFTQIKQSSYFKNFNWNELESKTMNPPEIPKLNKNKKALQKKHSIKLLQFLKNDIESFSLDKPVSWDKHF